MHFRATSLTALLAAVLVAGCKEQTPIPNTPTHIVIVGGAKQTGDLSTALDSSLAVQVLDGASRPVSGVPLTWTVIGGGALSAATTTSDNDGKSTVKWTLAPTAGTQVVTVTSTQVTGASVSFVASNGATITGTVTSNGVLPFGATFSRASRPARFGAAPSVSRRAASNRIVIGFRNGVLGVAAAGSSSYRSMSVARSALARMQQRVSAISAAQPQLTNAELSPAILAARFRVQDTTQVEALMESLRADPSVEWVERDEVVSIRDGAPRPMEADVLSRLLPSASSSAARSAVGTRLPNDAFYYEQSWSANMVDLPRAWTLSTGSSAVMVAVIDMGIRFDHADIAANLTNDGYDFVSSTTFPGEPICGGGSLTSINGDGDGPDADPTDPDDIEFDTGRNCWAHNTLGDHGLWTAGIVGAVGNEGVGIAGVNWNVKIRPVRVLGIDGSGFTFDIAQGILYAAGLPAAGANGAIVQAPSRAPIINMSLGGSANATVQRNAVTAATNAGSLIIASAGNDGLDFNTYPAAYPGVMGVAAVGMDGGLATYSNAGTFLSVSAPGGDFRLDDNGGGGVLGPGWNFVTNKPVYLFGYGTSASAPFVSGVAALMLAKEPSLTGPQIKSRIEQYASRGTGLSRSDVFGWGIVNAFNAMTQQNGPTHATIARLVDATTGVVGRTTTVDANGSFVFTKVQSGSYYLQAGDDENSDGAIGLAGRRFTWAGGFGKPTVFNVNGNSSSAAIVLGTPMEVEPNDDIAHANLLSIGSYVAGTITTPDVRDVYSVQIPVAGVYTIETSGLVGTCGFGIELDTFISVTSVAGTVIGSSDNAGAAALPTGPACSRVQTTFQPGIYYITVTGTGVSGLASHGRYRLEVRSGT